MISNARIRKIVFLTALAGLVLASDQAFAQSASTTFTVQAQVVNRCTIAAANLSFGNYDPTSAAATDAQSQVTVSCTRGVSATIALNDGLQPDGQPRQMAGPGPQFLTYELYRLAGRTAADRWGSAGAELRSYLAASRAPVALDVFGRIPAQQDVSAGAFTDTVQATINF